MTKSELVSSIADATGLTKVAAEKTIKSIIAEVTACLAKGDKLTLVGFGAFDTVKRAARKGQNPRTGKKINISASVSPKFRAGKALKETVNSKKK